MGDRVDYERDGSIAVITMDDGKVNALSFEMFEELNAALDKAEADEAVVVLTGRDGVFSAGFDLKILTGGGEASLELLMTGFELSYRMLSFPRPIVVAVSGHAMAMGLFLVLSADERIGAAGADHKVVANEVAIGMTLPRAAIEICRYRLHPAHFQRVMNLATLYTPDSAVEAGLLDRVVAPEELLPTARKTAAALAELNLAAHAATKLRVRAPALAALRAAIDEDRAELSALL